MTSTSRTKTKGVYRVTHTKTGHFYIGSSKNCELRFYQHHRAFVRGNNITKLQAVNDTHGNHWTYEVIETVPVESDLKGREEDVQRQVKGNPLCLNTKVDGHAPLRNYKRSVKDGNAHVRGLLGKNLKDPQFSRDEVVTLVSPSGETYNVRSIKRFARNHGLTQSCLNSVAQGKTLHHKGWRLPTTPLDLVYRPMQRINVTVVSPDGTEYTVTDLNKFCHTHKVGYHNLYNQIKRPNGKFSKDVGDSDEYGRRWYVKGNIPVFTVTDTKTGETWNHITVLPRLERTLGVKMGSFRKVLNGELKRVGRRYTIVRQGDR